MAVQNGDRVMHLGKAALETLDRLWRQRNLRDENDRAATALERGGDRLQIDFRLAAAAHAMHQYRTRGFRRCERFCDLVEGEYLLRVHFQICRRDKLFVRVWIAF